MQTLTESHDLHQSGVATFFTYYLPVGCSGSEFRAAESYFFTFYEPAVAAAANIVLPVEYELSTGIYRCGVTLEFCGFPYCVVESSMLVLAVSDDEFPLGIIYDYISVKSHLDSTFAVVYAEQFRRISCRYLDSLLE